LKGRRPLPSRLFRAGSIPVDPPTRPASFLECFSVDLLNVTLTCSLLPPLRSPVSFSVPTRSSARSSSWQSFASLSDRAAAYLTCAPNFFERALGVFLCSTLPPFESHALLDFMRRPSRARAPRLFIVVHSLELFPPRSLNRPPSPFIFFRRFFLALSFYT